MVKYIRSLSLSLFLYLTSLSLSLFLSVSLSVCVCVCVYKYIYISDYNTLVNINYLHFFVTMTFCFFYVTIFLPKLVIHLKHLKVSYQMHNTTLISEGMVKMLFISKVTLATDTSERNLHKILH